MQTSFYLLGGEQRRGRVQDGRSTKYLRGRIVEIDIESGTARLRVAYESPPELRAGPGSSMLFKAGHRQGDTLYACTTTEVLAFSLPDFRRTLHVSHPWFNDCHHVLPSPDGHLWVASTGIDLVVEVTRSGEVVRDWSAAERGTWSRLQRERDYRKVASMKPNYAHPNFMVHHRGHLWVTRFQQKDALCLTDPARTIPLRVGNPHDGVVHGRHAYFTTTNGHVVVADLERCEVERTIDLHAITPGIRELGWCRGIAVLDEQRIIVAFSRLRPTRWKENLKGLRTSLRRYGVAPTRIVAYDLEGQKVLHQQNVEDHGLNAVFSIHPVVRAGEPTGDGARTQRGAARVVEGKTAG